MAGIITTAIESINAGNFEIRVVGSCGALRLTEAMVAFAQARSEMPEKGVDHWANVEDPKVIAQVLEFYSQLSTAQKTTISHHPAVKIKRSLLQIAKMNKMGKEGEAPANDLL